MNDSLYAPIEPFRPPRRTKRPGYAATLAVGIAAALAAPAEGAEPVGELPYTAVVDLEYYLEPDPKTASTPRPLCLLMSGGNGDWRAAQGVMRGLGPAFLERGWAVAVPIAPEGRGFMGRNGRLVPKLVDELQSLIKYITDDPALIAGVSNGGIAALEIAAEDPDQFAAVLAIPGVLSRDTKIRNLRDMPIYLRVGENDHLNWGRAIPEITQRLREAGALVDAKALAGQEHGITIDWPELDAWLQQALGENAPAALRAMAAPGPTLRIPPSPNRPVRTWTSRTGATVNAALLQADSQAAVLQTPAGRRVRIEYGQLSDADQQHLRELSGMMPPP